VWVVQRRRQWRETTAPQAGCAEIVRTKKRAIASHCATLTTPGLSVQSNLLYIVPGQVEEQACVNATPRSSTRGRGERKRANERPAASTSFCVSAPLSAPDAIYFQQKPRTAAQGQHNTFSRRCHHAVKEDKAWWGS
jgi:hypothetical protein